MTSQNISLLKICPFMSRPAPGFKTDGAAIWKETNFIPCQREKCQAWIEPCDIYTEDIHEQDKTMQECPAFERDCEQSRPCCAGYCILIHQRGRS